MDNREPPEGSRDKTQEESNETLEDVISSVVDADEPKDEPEDKSNEVADDKTDETKGKGVEEESETDDSFSDKELAALSERTRTRIETLQHRSRDVGEQYEALRSVFNDTGGSPDEIMEVLDFLKLSKAGDSKGALKIIDKYRESLAVSSGMDIPGIDLLSTHTDLSKRVEDMELSREDALTIARARNSEQQTQLTQTAEKEQQQQNAKLKIRIDTALQDVQALENKLAASDVNWKMKVDPITNYIKRISQYVPPESWAQEIQHYYDEMHLFIPKVENHPNALRPGGGNNDQKPEPKTIEDVINGVLSA